MPTTHEDYTTHTLELSDGMVTARLVWSDEKPMLHLYVRNASPAETEDHSCRIAFDTTEAADFGRWLIDRAEEFAARE